MAKGKRKKCQKFKDKYIMNIGIYTRNKQLVVEGMHEFYEKKKVH